MMSHKQQVVVGSPGKLLSQMEDIWASVKEIAAEIEVGPSEVVQ